MKGIGYIQLERCGLHNINSHIGANKEPSDEEYDEEPPDLMTMMIWNSRTRRLPMMRMTTLEMRIGL